MSRLAPWQLVGVIDNADDEFLDAVCDLESGDELNDFIEQWAKENEIFGFTYLICIGEGYETDSAYIGSKALFRMVKGKQRRTQWRTYCSSSRIIKAKAKENPAIVERNITGFARSKAELQYLEAKDIFEHDALTDRHFANRYLRLHISRKHLIKENE